MSRVAVFNQNKLNEMLEKLPSSKRVMLSDIEKLLDNAEKEEVVFWGKEILVSYHLENGFTVCGRSACVDIENFNAEVGRMLCRKDVENQLWKLEGYKLQCELYQECSDQT